MTIAESDDYATQVLADAWDMKNPEDIRWPYGFSVPTIENGVWSAVSGPNSSVFFQFQGFPGAFSYIGEKDGRNYPISTTRFTHMRFRMYSERAGVSYAYWFLQPGDTAPCDNCHPGFFLDVQAGWHIYDYAFNTEPARWSGHGSVAGLRFDTPINQANNNVKFDWVRLTPDTATPLRIAWTYSAAGNPNVDLYVSTSPDPNADQEYKIATVPANTGSYTWSGTGLAPGTYYIHAVMGASVSASGPVTVNTAAIVKIDAPSPLSGEDFAQARLGTAWDGSNSQQFELTINCTPIIYGPDYWQSSSVPIPGSTVQDPQVFWLFPYGGGDPNITIDTSRYHYMNTKLWLQSALEHPTSPWNAGPRFTWARDDQSGYVQTQAFLAPYDRWLPVAVDLATVPTVPDPDPSQNYGWTGLMRVFRFDPHEEDDFGGPGKNLPFFRVGGAHLMSDPLTGPSTLVRWHKTQGGGTVSLFYDTDNRGYDGQPIPNASGLPINSGSFGWSTQSLPNGARYYVYAVVTDGLNTTRFYSDVPITVNHASASTIFTDIPTGHWAANDVNNLAVRRIINGYSQFDGTLLFKAGNQASRAQLSKMVVLAANAGIVSPTEPTFADVPTSSPLYAYVETAAALHVVGGYPCGGPGEPCGAGTKPYFRPNNNVTRAQTAKMISLSLGWTPLNPADPTFADVPASAPLYPYVESAAQHGIIGGYPCGGAGEPCGAGNKPYFRPGRDVSRGQISKMLSTALGPFTGAPGSEK